MQKHLNLLELLWKGKLRSSLTPGSEWECSHTIDKQNVAPVCQVAMGMKMVSPVGSVFLSSQMAKVHLRVTACEIVRDQARVVGTHGIIGIVRITRPGAPMSFGPGSFRWTCWKRKKTIALPPARAGVGIGAILVHWPLTVHMLQTGAGAN